MVSTLGYTAAISVVVAVCAAATLLPAMLGALGPHINSLRFHIGKTHPDDKEPRGWRNWAERIVKMPWRSTLVALFILILLALPIFKLQLGHQQDEEAEPDDDRDHQRQLFGDLVREVDVAGGLSTHIRVRLRPLQRPGDHFVAQVFHQ